MAVVQTGGGFGAEIVVDGLGSVRNALDDIEPKLRRKLDRDLKKTVGVTAERAGRRVDSRTGKTAEGYKVERRGETFKITNKVLGASVLEKWNQPRCPQGEHLVATLNEKYGSPGRILWTAWTETRDYVVGKVALIVEDVEFEIQQELGA